MQALQNVINYQDKQIRVVVKDGEPWFVARDVCAVLEIVNSRDAVARLDEDEKGSFGGNGAHQNRSYLDQSSGS
ncbi:Bro-N domain-containing protein [Brevibacillus sp. NPDC058079]|uniref:BRO-N domain-containing protein n=1 Tax=Brevibacillus sp. NPDC058079 TaxID=3346330 RepID=UPI0036E8D5F7